MASYEYVTDGTPFKIRNGYAKSQEVMTVRNPANVAEMWDHCAKHSHIWVRTQHGTAKQVKVNGAVRTWKRDPNRIEVPCKYGLYEYFTLQARDITDVLIPVEETCPCDIGHPERCPDAGLK